jgi:hypothetical protein
MDGLDYWRLCDQLSVVQAAMLVVGSDPSSDAMHVEGWSPDKRPPGYEAAKTAIANALRRGQIDGEWIAIPSLSSLAQPNCLAGTSQ